MALGLKPTRVPAPFCVRPSANGDSPQCVVGTVPKGHLRAPVLRAMAGKDQTDHCNVLKGMPSVVDNGSLLVLHMLLCQQMPGSWARGIMPRVSSTF